MQTGPTTQLLLDIERGDATARERLWAAVYEELRRLAKAHMAGERRGRTTGTTVLVHEAYLRLLGPAGKGGLAKRRRGGRIAL